MKKGTKTMDIGHVGEGLGYGIEDYLDDIQQWPEGEDLLKVKCPECGEELDRVMDDSSMGGFWQCANLECLSIFNDNDDV